MLKSHTVLACAAVNAKEAAVNAVAAASTIALQGKSVMMLLRRQWKIVPVEAMPV
jgi:hypothetical protein